MNWQNWIPTGPDWASNEAVLRLGSVQERWTGSAGWQGMAMAAVLASFFIIALAYMIGYAFNHEGMRKWGRGELYQAFANAMLVIGLVAIVNIMVVAVTVVTADIATAGGGLVYAGTGQAFDNPFALAETFVDENIGCLRTWYLNMFIADTFVEPLSDVTIGIAGMDALSLSVVLGPVVSGLYFASHNVVFLLLANYFQRHLIIFIFQTMFTVFLPIGIILRILPVTRGFGGFLIAMAIGLYIVYPLSYSALMLTTRQMDLGTCSLTIDAAEVRGMQMTDEATFTYQRARSERFLDAIKEQTLGRFQGYFMFFMYRSFIFPLVALTLTFTFVRTTAAFFGADIAEMSRGLIKLI